MSKLQEEKTAVIEQIKTRQTYIQELQDIIDIEKIILKQDKNKLKAIESIGKKESSVETLQKISNGLK